MDLPTSGGQTEQPKYDNFYSPKNSDFYSRFHYANLNQHEQSIRLLRIYPTMTHDDKQATIKCDLLDNQPLAKMKGKFTTISYCAGDPKNVETILVNGIEFNAFANLGHALRQARHFWEERCDDQQFLIWADQVCINQSNPTERAHQVGIMGEIYKTAKQVLISLSVENDLPGGIDWVRRLINQRLSVIHRDIRDDALFHDRQDLHEDIEEVIKQNCHDELFHFQWHAFIKTVLISPWWTRAWIRQEFVRSSDAFFMASYDSIHWTAFANIMNGYASVASRYQAFACEHYQEFFSKSVTHNMDPTGASLEQCEVCHINDYYSNSDLCRWKADARAEGLLEMKIKAHLNDDALPDLLLNLTDTHMLQASDERDLVYSLLACSAHDYGIVPTYSADVSVQDVFVHLAQQVITRNKNLYILFLAYHHSGYAYTKFLNPNLPSWVPNWRLRPYHGWASIDSTASPNLEVSFHADNEGRKGWVLRVQGVALDYLDRETFHAWKKKCVDMEVLVPNRWHPDENGLSLWVIRGSDALYVLKPCGGCYKIILVMLDLAEDVQRLVDKVKDLTQTGDRALMGIDLC